MDNSIQYRSNIKENKKFDFKKHKDNTLCSLKEVEKFLTCATKAKNYAFLLKLFK